LFTISFGKVLTTLAHIAKFALKS